MGLDPGSRQAGYGVVEQAGNRLRAVDYGVVAAREGDPLPTRLRVVFEGLRQAVRRLRPDVISIEEVFYGKSVSSTLRMGEARGVAMLAASLESVPVVEYAAAEVKKAAVGAGRATKEQVQEMVRILLGLPRRPESDHAADALALAVCHCNRSRFDLRLPADAPAGPGRRRFPPEWHALAQRRSR
jgi:crossover junction endodeoxyribonuclease RuvC